MRSCSKILHCMYHTLDKWWIKWFFFLSNLLYKMSELWEFQKTLNLVFFNTFIKFLRNRYDLKHLVIKTYWLPCLQCVMHVPFFHLWSDELWMPVPQFDNYSDFDNSEYKIVMQISRLKWKIVGRAEVLFPTSKVSSFQLRQA